MAGERGAWRRTPPSPYQSSPSRTAGNMNGSAAEASTWSTVSRVLTLRRSGRFPVQDLAALHPRYRLARRVVNRGEGDRFQQTPLELLGDADNLAVDGREASLE